MSTQYFTLTIVLLLVFFTLQSFQQNCTSSLFSETETPATLDDSCPISYVNFGKACLPFSTIYKQKKEISCTSTSDCLFTSLECVNHKCLPKIRLSGDSCVDDMQCISNVPLTISSSVADIIGPKCINNRCQNLKVERKNDGEECFIDRYSKIIYDCKVGSICSTYGTGSKCVPKLSVRKGESCFNPTTDDKSTIFNYKYCESGSYCKSLSDGSQICVEPLIKGSICANSTTRCQDGTVCRQNSPTDSTFTCQNIATYGESCVLDSDCAYGTTQFVKCYNNKCQRIFGTVTNGICKQDDECYTRYCSPEGRCAERSNNIPCSTSNDCPFREGCACGGKGNYSNSFGRCASNLQCYGPYTDMLSCVFNLGITFKEYYFFGGFGYSQFVDEESSVFTRCRNAYSRFYSCFRKVFISTGIPTKGEMEGVDLDAYSVYASPILPGRSGASQNQLVFGLALSIMMLVTLIL
ncbi:hypothetical protein NAEGRDRAFT_81868 [Naegleria gruberi]|uniref:Dickkopf N-terminal cysteine-rich domain-containing protein n=1 Tax=Naegleria gruberi TaxID=5762 RepID=D2VZU0_NAEGR|nr:uncharacterized protein NAEGRDRAFT_81868 [Naegleria gruberi]EFC37588.1 hypothetical protein NAEGRDRAFT_81868 [Naegleria gruberi]|eukprot:XP_002670332.1 hypothetical protein NAEGRDRAFT_81868 [Naegleria gruberi strain NEG-M]